MKLRKVPNGLTPAIYHSLRDKVRFQSYADYDVAEALKRTLYSVVIYDVDRPVGISRVVGDGKIVFFIKDVVVDPEYQRRGIGKLLMKDLMHYVNQAGCTNAYVGLMCTPGTENFYNEFGFIRRPTEDLGSGMVQFIHTRDDKK